MKKILIIAIFIVLFLMIGYSVWRSSDQEPAISAIPIQVPDPITIKKPEKPRSTDIETFDAEMRLHRRNNKNGPVMMMFMPFTEQIRPEVPQNDTWHSQRDAMQRDDIWEDDIWRIQHEIWQQPAVQELQFIADFIQPDQLIVTIQEQTPDDRRKNDKQNVHQSAVLKSSNNILKSQERDVVPRSGIEKSAIQFINSLKTTQDKKKAIKQIQYICKVNANISAYNRTEKQILDTLIQLLKRKNNPEFNEYFMTQLLESVNTCSTGRATRLIDAIGFASDQQIIPEYVITEKVQDKLAQMSKMETPSKTDFADYLQREFMEKGLITSTKYNEFMKWFDDGM